MVIVPAYNEQASLRDVVSELLSYSYEVIVVDDGSQTDLRSSIAGLQVYFLQHEINLGQGAALQTGIEFALHKAADIIVTFDADGQHCVEDINALIEPLESGEVEMSLGSRFLEGGKHNMSFSRRIILQSGRFINYLFTGLLLSDAHNGLRAMTSKAAAKIHLKENRMAHASELLWQISSQNIRYREIPVHIRYTAYSKKKGQSAFNSVRIVFDLILNKIFR